MTKDKDRAERSVTIDREVLEEVVYRYNIFCVTSPKDSDFQEVAAAFHGAVYKLKQAMEG